MSDSTANAREPSMEDILASIRRIIDEEDTRDGRPVAEDEGQAADRDPGVGNATMPVMAAAPINRDDDAEDGLYGELDDRLPENAGGLGRDEETVFPERESPFWSRATGRADSDDGEGSGDDSGYRESVEEGDQDTPLRARTDIFTRAQHKLGTSARLSARERIQSLAARAQEHGMGDENVSRADPVAPDPAHISDSIDRVGTEPGHDVPPSFDTRDESLDGVDDRETQDFMENLEEDDVLELTDPIEQPADSGDRSIMRAGFGEGEARQDDGNTVQESTAFEELPSQPDVSSLWKDDNGDAPDHNHDMDDVLDLMTPIDEEGSTVDAGNVESGEAFSVSEVDVEDDAIEEAISHNLATDDNVGESEGAYEAQTLISDTEEEDSAPLNTYSRFDRDEHQGEYPRQGDVPDETSLSDDYSAAFMMLDSEPAASDAPSHEAESAHVEEALPGQPDDDTEEGGPEADDPLGFADTFGASDVYHDDPPALDEDYSRSLDDSEELAAEQAAFAAQVQKDGGMEAVGGMVRDAMERDPVDYADPAALVSMTSEEISARALASLADVEGEASRRVYGSLKISESSDGSDSLEGMVRGMLKPMLREWLDDNLPTMVESAVRGEVERISSKSRKYSRAADND